MNIKIENDQVVLELTELEFAAFEGMFQNLNDNHTIIIEGREWWARPTANGSGQTILPY